MAFLTFHFSLGLWASWRPRVVGGLGWDPDVDPFPLRLQQPPALLPETNCLPSYTLAPGELPVPTSHLACILPGSSEGGRAS